MTPKPSSRKDPKFAHKASIGIEIIGKAMPVLKTAYGAVPPQNPIRFVPYKP